MAKSGEKGSWVFVLIQGGLFVGLGALFYFLPGGEAALTGVVGDAPAADAGPATDAGPAGARATEPDREGEGRDDPADRFLPWPEQIAWVGVGGGSSPEQNQVSLEQDLTLAGEVFSGPSVVLYAGGPDSRAVQVQDPDQEDPDPLLRRIGDLLDARAARGSRYRPARIAAQGRASRQTLLRALRIGREGGGEAPLFVFAATHGSDGDSAGENSIGLWGEEQLDAVELVGHLGERPEARPIRFVMTACYSGGFAEMVFREADPSLGATEQDRCGLFAAPWDDVASGCDPNPDRVAQDSYAAHFLHALRGRDLRGHELFSAHIDLDGDGRISLLEAHLRARLYSRAYGDPTTTSERYLRSLFDEEQRSRWSEVPIGAESQALLPEEHAFVHTAERRLGLDGLGALEARARALEGRMEEADAHEEEIAQERDAAFYGAVAALLHRFPVLDDPYHPDFRRTLEEGREEIEAFFERSMEMSTYERAQGELERVQGELERLEREMTPLRRLFRAYETVHLAQALAQRGGPELERYRRFLDCERAVPEVQDPWPNSVSLEDFLRSGGVDPRELSPSAITPPVEAPTGAPGAPPGGGPR